MHWHILHGIGMQGRQLLLLGNFAQFKFGEVQSVKYSCLTLP
jgi:hypothetical protein